MRTIAFCEISEWCRKVLSKHWPIVPIFEDVTTIGVEPMSSAEDSPARTSASPEQAPALPASVPLSGGGYAEPFAWYDQSTRSWRTWQRCLTGEWEPWLATWPRSGMTRSGIAYRLPTLVPLTYGTGFGSSDTHSIPTPTASDHIERENTTGVLNFETNKAVTLDRFVKMWPTPRSSDGTHGGRVTPRKSREGGNLIEAVSARTWPTPTSRDYKDGSAASCANVPTNGLLGRVVHQWPTPTANRWDGLQSHGKNAISGSLNPTWVEWLMGYPLGWTVLKDWGMRSSRKSRKSSGGRS